MEAIDKADAVRPIGRTWIAETTDPHDPGQARPLAYAESEARIEKIDISRLSAAYRRYIDERSATLG